MDLSLDSWDYDLSIIQFDTETELLTFVANCQPLMDQVTLDNNHDRFTYFINFYRKYKAQTSSLFDFFAVYDPQDYPTKNRPDCIGRALKLKEILESHYPHLKDKLYIASNTFDYTNLNRKITKDLLDNYHYFVSFNEHCVLTLKFEMEGRVGFILYEMSFLNDKPIIVMSDNLSPSYQSVSLPKGRKASYVCKDGYVEVSFAPEEGAEASVTGIDVYTLALFVGGSFKRQDLSATFCLIPNIQYCYAIRNGKLVANFSHYGADPFFNLQRWDSNAKRTVKCKIPLSYFSQEDRDELFESELKELSLILSFEYGFFRDAFVTIANIQRDTDFLKQLTQLPLSMKSNREKYVRSLVK